MCWVLNILYVQCGHYVSTDHLWNQNRISSGHVYFKICNDISLIEGCDNVVQFPNHDAWNWYSS